ncbi:MAG: hypothetical protein KC933_38185 [Myxococcales bacterium]|nr:hypothetical protein [Myxococcales bacterium]MCB9647548.1 hypothetical protein [Deltaproteobacteria bacterium]
MGHVDGIREKLSMGGIDLGTKSMTNIMQSKEPWAQAILQADRQILKNAALLNHLNQPRVYGTRGNGNLYGAIANGLAVAAGPQQSKDPTVQKAFTDWANNLNNHPLFKARNSYTPAMLLQIAADADAVACQLRDNVKKLTQEAEVGPNDIAHWNGVATGMSEYSAALKHLHEVVTAKHCPNVTSVTLDIAAPQH